MENNYLNYYQLLGVESDATTEEILKAYKQKAQEYHPDKNSGHHSAKTLFQYIQEAKNVLSDHKKRLEYDYVAGVKKRPEPTPKIVQMPYPVQQKTDKSDVAAAALGGVALGILAAIFIGTND